MEFRAVAKYRRISPRKLRFVAKRIRGLNVMKALLLLDTIPNRGARILKEVIKSARANAVDLDSKKDLGINADRLFISRLVVDGGPTLRRYRPMSMGRAGRIRKRTSHISVTLEEPAALRIEDEGRE
ncbi:MAG: 50S ribosomal protein L22 [Candidatus Hydrogenedentota bacterium]|nr:MAG: 50S ribosomal protein L22 [Candidatus Hydrogenedentota bacterium]